jgi:hypothetical protein
MNVMTVIVLKLSVNYRIITLLTKKCFTIFIYLKCSWWNNCVRKITWEASWNGARLGIAAITINTCHFIACYLNSMSYFNHLHVSSSVHRGPSSPQFLIPSSCRVFCSCYAPWMDKCNHIGLAYSLSIVKPCGLFRI